MEASTAKVQFNVYLPPDLVRRLKHHAIDDGQSMSAFVQQVMEAELRRRAEQEGHPS